MTVINSLDEQENIITVLMLCQEAKPSIRSGEEGICEPILNRLWLPWRVFISSAF